MTERSSDMPDITMCAIEDCPLKGTCYRAVDQPRHSQVFFKEDPRKDAWHRPSDCKYFFAEPDGDNIKKRVFYAINYLGSKRYGKYPKMLWLNRDKYNVFLRHLCLTSFVEFPLIRDLSPLTDCF